MDLQKPMFLNGVERAIAITRINTISSANSELGLKLVFFRRICGFKDLAFLGWKHLDFTLSLDNKPVGSEEVTGHRSSSWLVTYLWANSSS
jgi:hypothetical protein